ncbi:MAG: hypothetical protein WKF94_07960 [Solirubrobacteraceae bacterium]
MDRQPHRIDEDALDARLRDHGCAPDPHWVRATEQRLFAPRESWLQRLLPSAPVARFGAALAVSLAALLSVFSLAGSGPSGMGERPAQADDNCRSVTVTRMTRVPAIVRDADGKLRVVYDRQPVERLERRCG